MGRCLFWLLQVILFWVFCPFAYSIFRLIIMKPALVKVVPNNLALPNGGMLVIKSFLVKFFHSKNIFLMFCCWRWGLRFIYFAPVVIMAVFWLVFVCFFIKTKNICFHHQNLFNLAVYSNFTRFQFMLAQKILNIKKISVDHSFLKIYPFYDLYILTCFLMPYILIFFSWAVLISPYLLIIQMLVLTSTTLLYKTFCHLTKWYFPVINFIAIMMRCMHRDKKNYQA